MTRHFSLNYTTTLQEASWTEKGTINTQVLASSDDVGGLFEVQFFSQRPVCESIVKNLDCTLLEYCLESNHINKARTGYADGAGARTSIRLLW